MMSNNISVCIGTKYGGITHTMHIANGTQAHTQTHATIEFPLWSQMNFEQYWNNIYWTFAVEHSLFNHQPRSLFFWLLLLLFVFSSFDITAFCLVNVINPFFVFLSRCVALAMSVFVVCGAATNQQWPGTPMHRADDDDKTTAIYYVVTVFLLQFSFCRSQFWSMTGWAAFNSRKICVVDFTTSIVLLGSSTCWPP